MKPRIIVEQKITPLVNQYRVYRTDQAGEKAEMIAFAQQKRFAFKEKVLFYGDLSKTNLLFSFRAEKVMDFHGRFLVEDATGQLIGTFKKEFAQSIVISTWSILGKDNNPIFQVRESSQALAVLRRFGGEIPILGALVDIVVMFFKYHFEVVDMSSNAIVGSHAKTTLFRDFYKLSLDDGPEAAVDWRVWVSVAVALDMLQGR